MTKILRQDLNNHIVNGSFPFMTKKTLTFDGVSPGAVGTVPLFNVTGVIAFRLFGHIRTTGIGAGNISVGTANNTTAILSAAAATALVAGDVWVFGSSPAEVGSLAGTGTAATPFVAVADILAAITTNTITAGVIDFYIMWDAISANADVSEA